jgi:hypothetical protein
VRAVSVHLPDWLHKQLRECANREGISINQLISSAAAEKMAALMTEDYLKARAQQGNRKRFLAAIRSAPDVEPEPYDRLPSRPTRSRRRKRAGS